MKLQDSKILYIVPRFSDDIAGGAEALVSQYAFNSTKFFKDVSLWTTCAKDHTTWDNHFEAGEEKYDRLTVRRFEVSPRDVSIFLGAEMEMAQGYGIETINQINWFKNGVNSIELYSALKAHAKDFDFILFAPYLFPINFWSLLISKKYSPKTKNILIPCLHDEHYAYQEIIFHMFKNVDSILFNANAEKELAKKLYGDALVESKSKVVGMGFDFTTKVNNEYIDNEFGKYIVYCGRKEEGKNVGLLIEYFCKAQENKEELKDLKLVFLGSGNLEFASEYTQNSENIIELGFVSEERKASVIANALALCQPSVNESFSIVLFESWKEKTPVIVHSDCSVTKEHVDKSGGGFCFENEEEFLEVCKTLVNSGGDELASKGSKGLKYSIDNYSIDVVNNRFISSFNNFS